jgi:beta-lactam-binding protein with PASTA domain
MSLAPLSSPSVTPNADPAGEVISASLAKKQQVMEGKAAVELLQSAGQVAAPKVPSGASGHNVNIVV